MRPRMQDKKRQTERPGKGDFLDERLHGFGAVAGRPRAQIDQIPRVPKNGGELEARFLPLEQRDVGGRRRPSEPLHIILDKYLDDLAADGRPAFQRLVNPAADRHVSAEFHLPQRNAKNAKRQERNPESFRGCIPCLLSWLIMYFLKYPCP